MRVTLIRHGITQGNIEKRYIGRTDQPLSEFGINKLKELKYDDVCKVYASPMKRCVQTASVIYPGKEINIVDDLREIDFGTFEGKTHNELNGDIHYQAWIDSGGLGDIPQGERFDTFTNRCVKAFEKVLENEQLNDIAFVVHGGTIMALMHKLGNMNYFDAMVDNGKGFVCEYKDKKLKVIHKL